MNHFPTAGVAILDFEGKWKEPGTRLDVACGVPPAARPGRRLTRKALQPRNFVAHMGGGGEEPDWRRFPPSRDEAKIAFDNVLGTIAGRGTPTVRLGVTGLSRAGKTVFITALVHNLVHGGRLPLFERMPRAASRKRV